MTRNEIFERWRVRLSEWSKYGATVSGEKVAAEVLADLKAVTADYDEAEMGLSEAAQESGYSTRQLSRMIADGRLKNVGRQHAPRILRTELPRKARARTDTSGIVGGTSLLQIGRQSVRSKSSKRGTRNGTQG